MSTRIPHLTDRKETGLLLANKLQRFQDNPRTLILALPRGGVEVGCMLSTQLRLPLDVFLTRKLGYPRNPEYAVGAITEMGLTWFNADASDMKRTMGFKDFLDEEFPRQQWKLNGRKSCFDREKKLPPLDGYTIMLVDDGIATGSTFMAFLHSLRTFGINRLIGAIPLGPAATTNRIRTLVDHGGPLQARSFYRGRRALSTFPSG